QGDSSAYSLLPAREVIGAYLGLIDFEEDANKAQNTTQNQNNSSTKNDAANSIDESSDLSDTMDYSSKINW
ncbi:MAG: hypothetical protein LBR30_07905, partial [Clostridioides sp.]|nr:hypothetical protein [Clostridioides sp.]